ncbi:F-box domain-containing protein [Mycena kentingensis (nom. inval.)]|nr:F-box domain-containing protein [Mycena kentingensis (nom. inval.)]
MKYEATPGYFAQDAPDAVPATIGAVPARFGLLDDSEGRWENLLEKLRHLNGAGEASYKLVIFGRHGQGFHNVAEEKYGTKAWDDHWAMLDGDGEGRRTSSSPDNNASTLRGIPWSGG